MTILDNITAYKLKEVAAKKEAIPTRLLEKFPLFSKETKSLAEALRISTTGIIAEHKRRSPSKLVINDKVLLPEVVSGYENAGAKGISVLTDSNFFGGSLDDLLVAEKTVSIPNSSEGIYNRSLSNLRSKSVWCGCYFIDRGLSFGGRIEAIFAFGKKLKIGCFVGSSQFGRTSKIFVAECRYDWREQPKP